MDLQDKSIEKVKKDILKLTIDRMNTRKLIQKAKNDSKYKKEALKRVDHLRSLCLDNASAYEEAYNLNKILLNNTNSKLMEVQKEAIQGYLSLIEFLDKYSESLKSEMEFEPKVKKPQPEENPYPNIFKGNGFKIWEQYRIRKKINNKSRTDVRFIYEVLKYDGLIHKTIGEKSFRDWIAEKYNIVMDKNNYTNPKQHSNYNRMALYQTLKDSMA